MKKLSTVLLALSMIFGSDVQARRGKSTGGVAKGQQSKITAENFVEKIAATSEGTEEEKVALKKVLEEVQVLVKQDPKFIVKIEEAIAKVQVEKVKAFIGKKRKRARMVLRKKAAELSKVLGDLSKSPAPAAVKVTKEQAHAEFVKTLAQSKIFGDNFAQPASLSLKFAEALKFDGSGKLVDLLNVSLAETDEAKKFEALKTLLVQLDPSYQSLKAPRPTAETVLLEIRKATQASGQFTNSADIEAKINAIYKTYLESSVEVQDAYFKGMRNYSEKAAFMSAEDKKANFNSLNTNKQYENVDMSNLATVDAIVKKVLDNEERSKDCLKLVKVAGSKLTALDSKEKQALADLSLVYANIFGNKGEIQNTYGFSKESLESSKAVMKDMIVQAYKKVSDDLKYNWAIGDTTQNTFINEDPNFAKYGKVADATDLVLLHAVHKNAGLNGAVVKGKAAKTNLLFSDGTSFANALLTSNSMDDFAQKPAVAEFLTQLGTYPASAFLESVQDLLQSPAYRGINNRVNALDGIIDAFGLMDASFGANIGLGRVQMSDLETIVGMALGHNNASKFIPATAEGTNGIVGLGAPVAGEDLVKAVDRAKTVVKFFER